MTRWPSLRTTAPIVRCSEKNTDSFVFLQVCPVQRRQCYLWTQKSSGTGSCRCANIRTPGFVHSDSDGEGQRDDGRNHTGENRTEKYVQSWHESSFCVFSSNCSRNICMKLTQTQKSFLLFDKCFSLTEHQHLKAALSKSFPSRCEGVISVALWCLAGKLQL